MINPLQPIALVINGAGLVAGYLRSPRRVTIDVITVDAVLHDLTAVEVDVTQHPVEAGGNVSDHARPHLREYSVEGVVSDTTLDDPDLLSLARALPFAGFVESTAATVQDLLAGSTTTRSQLVYQALEALALTAAVVEIVTPLKTYSQMMMTSLRVPRDPRTGEAINFSASFREVRFVQPVTTVIVLPQAPQQLGAQQPQAATGQLKKLTESRLVDIIGARNLNTVGLVRRPAVP